MSLRVEFLAGADADLQEVFNRFEDYRDGFGVEFMTVVDAYLAWIAVFPEIAPIYFERSPPGHSEISIRYLLRAFNQREFWLPRFSTYARMSNRYYDAYDTKAPNHPPPRTAPHVTAPAAYLRLVR